MDEELKQALERLTNEEKKLASLRYSFWRGVFNGFGIFIGSVVLVAGFLYALSYFADAPVVGHFFARMRDLLGSGK